MIHQPKEAGFGLIRYNDDSKSCVELLALDPNDVVLKNIKEQRKRLGIMHPARPLNHSTVFKSRRASQER